MDKKMTFEESINRLREVVSALERNDLPLEESLKLFEEGSKISGTCYEILKTSEQKITDISEKTKKAMTEE